MVHIEEPDEVFWGLTLEGEKKRYEQDAESDIHVSMAALEQDPTNSNGFVSLMFEREGKEFLLCTLQHGKLYQQALDLNFSFGEKLVFFTQGKGRLHLSGYSIADQTFDAEDDVSSSDDDDLDVSQHPDASMDSLVESLGGGKKRKQKQQLSGDKKKRARKDLDSSKTNDESSDDDDDDDDEDDESESETGIDFDSMLTEEGMNSEDWESDDDEDDDDDDDSDVDVEEEEQTPVKKGKKKNKKGNEVKGKQQKKKGDKATPQKNDSMLQGAGDAGQDAKKKKKNKNKNKSDANDTSLNNGNAPKDKKRFMKGGLAVQDIKVGHGPEVKNGQTVSVYYSGTLNSGKQFDSCEKGKPFKFKVGKEDVIKGWDLGLVGMKVGGKRKLTIPPKLGYGNQRMGDSIPPNSTLNFTIELKNVQ